MSYDASTGQALLSNTLSPPLTACPTWLGKGRLITDHDLWGSRCTNRSASHQVPSDAAPFSATSGHANLDDELRLLRQALALLADDPVGNLDAIVKAITTELRVLAWREKQHDGDGQLALALHAVAERVIDQFAGQSDYVTDASNASSTGGLLQQDARI